MKENFTPGERRGIIILICMMIMAAVVIKCRSGAPAHMFQPAADATVSDSLILSTDTFGDITDTILVRKKKPRRQSAAHKAKPVSKPAPLPRRTRDERIN